MTDDELWTYVTKTVTPLSNGKRTSYKLIPEKQEKSIFDLHGLTVHDAYLKSKEIISNNQNVIIITGKTGQIKKEFEDWFQNQNDPKHKKKLLKSGGAYKITFKKK